MSCQVTGPPEGGKGQGRREGGWAEGGRRQRGRDAGSEGAEGEMQEVR